MSNSNQNDLLKLWTKIDSLEESGLFSSALTLLDSLQVKAQELSAKDHMVKALFYKGKYYTNLKEDAAETVLQDFESALQDEKDISYKRIYHSILGELYYNYASQNQYKINQRTSTDSIKGGVNTWSIEDIVTKSNLHFTESVKDLDSEDIDIDNYKMLIKPFALNDPSFDLYSMLVMRAIKHFQNDRNLVSEPTYVFSLRDENAFSSIDDFIELDFDSNDHGSYKALTLKLYQKILAYHKRSKVVERLNVERLDYVRQIHLSENKDSLYQESVKRISGQSNYAKLAFAKSLFNGDDKKTNQLSYSLVKEILDDNIDSELKQRALTFINSLEASSLNVSVEQVYIPNKPALFHLSFKNIGELKFSIKQVNSRDLEELRNKNNREEQLAMVQSMNSLKSWDQLIPDTDFIILSSELMMPVLPVGHYILLTTSSEGLISYNVFQVSNLTYTTVNSSEGLELIVADRLSGLAKENVLVTFYKYDYRNKKKSTLLEAMTNSDGIVKFIFPQSGENYLRTNIKLELDDDVLEFNDMYSQVRSQDNKQGRMYTFSDRNMYRPNQRVYIKAILLSYDNDVLRNSKVDIQVQDPNGREVFKGEQTTNDYGSIATDFLLPSEGITGNFQVQLNSKDSRVNGYLSFQVEEYKRPTFFVEVDKPSIEYSLGDSLKLTGKTMMYSGPSVSDAKIEYRITRNQYHHYNWYNRRGGQSSPDAEIDFGTVNTGDNGEFEFSFLLKESSMSSLHKSSVFNFNVDIKATDITGETQYYNEQVKVSKKKVFVTSNLKDEVKFDELDSILVLSKNINGSSVPFNGTIVIQSLQTPKDFKRSKYWNNLDTVILSDSDYAQLPYDYKMNESDFNNWDVNEKIYSGEFNSLSGEHKFSLLNLNKNIYYRIIIRNSIDRELEYEKFFKIIDLEKGYVGIQNLFSYNLNQDTYEPGDQVELTIASNNKDVQLYYQFEKDKKLFDNSWIAIKKTPTKIKIPVNELDRGGFFIHLISFYRNRYQMERIKVDVPHTDKKLQIKLHSFKSTLTAGSEEDWTISIINHLGENVTAELLASMYDESLDALSSVHNWQEIRYKDYYSRIQYGTPSYRLVNGQFLKFLQKENYSGHSSLMYYPDINRFGYSGNSPVYARAGGRRMKSSIPAAESMEMDAAGSVSMMDQSADSNGVESEVQESEKNIDWSQVREVLDETVFFYPDLVTDKDGEVALKFRMSDALSSWKLQLFAHDKQGRHSLNSYILKSIKDVAIYPNVPRFLRVDDQLDLSGKIVNSSDGTIQTTTTIQFLNPDTNEDITNEIVSSNTTLSHSIKAQGSAQVNWDIMLKPQHLSGLIYRIHVGYANGSDAIKGFIPVTTNQVLITESLPIYVKGNQENKFVFEGLDRILESDEARLSKYVLEYTSNPSWYVIQALPFLSNHSFKSSVNLLNQYAANCIGKSIAKARPELKSTLENWSRTNSTALDSNLEKNQDLKSEKLINTPWLRQSQSETEQKKQIIKFFSENTIESQLNSTLTELLARQNNDGGFSWISQARSNLYITALILENIGRLHKLNIQHDIPHQQIQKAVGYIDRELEKIDKKDSTMRSYANHLQLLYARSFFIDQFKAPVSYLSLLNKVNQDWLDRELYEQAMIASILHRVSKEDEANIILKSLQEQVIRTENKGSYWKRNRQYYSNQSSIDKHVMMIELYHEMGIDQEQIDELKIWLLRNKQTNHWKNVKSTSSAVYAFLLNHSKGGSDWISDSKEAIITVGRDMIQSNKEAGTLYLRHDFEPQLVDAKSAIIQIKNPNEQAGWGAAYIQYYDDIKNIENVSLTELSIKKEIFKKSLKPTGPILEAIDHIKLIPGDKLVVRLEIQNDRSLEYVHVRDERASGLEPVNVISGYKNQDALQYYEVTRDDSSNFYMSRLPRGTHVFEYELTVNLNGSYSSGMATAQCIYAPEFIAHSNTIQLNVKAQSNN